MNWIEARRRRRRFRRLARAGVGGGLALAGLAAAGLLQPAEQTITRDRRLAAAPDLVWRVLNDLDGMPLWRSDVAALERLPDQDGHAVWREQPRGGGAGARDRIVALGVAEVGRVLVYRPARGDGFPPRTVELRPDGRATRVLLSERRVLRNPYRRLLGRLRPAGSGLDRFLDDLARRLAGPRELSALPGVDSPPP